MTREEILNTLFLGSDQRLYPRGPTEVDLVRYTRQGVIAFVTDILDDFEKELNKKQREYYTIGSNDCHNAMKESFSIKSIANGYNCDTCANNHLGYDSYTCVNCQEFYFKNWEKQYDN
jgi:hypothetical protein